MSVFKQLYVKIESRTLFDYLLFTFSILVFVPNIKWIFDVFFNLYDYFNLFLLLLISFIVFHKYSYKKLPKQLTINFQFKLLPFLIVLIALFIWFYGEKILGINILSSTGFCLYIFGVSGFYISSKKWLKAIIPFVLLIMTLPFGNMMDVYIGFPLRMLAIDSIASLFHTIGLNNVTSSTIITIENHATQIDFSCSGLKGLWSGLIFFFTISWLDQLKINLKWFFALLLLFGLLLLSNLFRIFTIISLNSIFELPEIANIIHAPLGIIGFVFSCLIILSLVKTKWYLGKNSPSIIKSAVFDKINLTPLSNFKLLREGLTLLLIGMLFTSSSIATKELDQLSIQFPNDWNATPLELTNDETIFFKEQGSVPIKMKFEFNQLNGSFLLLKSNGWRGHHNPEFCIRAGGVIISEVSTKKLDPNFPLKWIEINDTSSACYWFQSPTTITDDFSTRVWSEVMKEESDWVLVTMVFNNKTELNDHKTKATINQLSQLVKSELESSNKTLTTHD